MKPFQEAAAEDFAGFKVSAIAATALNSGFSRAAAVEVAANDWAVRDWTAVANPISSAYFGVNLVISNHAVVNPFEVAITE
jgi:hypothetical protein